MPSTRFVPSAIDREIRQIAAGYPARELRSDLEAVEVLRAAAGIDFPSRSIAVVGTNGKTSTAAFMERLLRRAGSRTGLTTSPHIRDWGERVAIDGTPIADERLLLELTRLHRLADDVAARGSLRFFDLLTLAAAGVFAEERVEVAIFEAGIGGRLDTTRLLSAPLSVLTSVGIDHEELLGDNEVDVLREKLGVAPDGGRVVAADLRPALTREAETIAASNSLDLRIARGLTGPFLTRNAALAVFALQNAPFDVGHIPERLDDDEAGVVPGRMQRLAVEGVEVLVDAAHNPQGWSELKALLPPGYVAVVSASRSRAASELAASLAAARFVVATVAWPGRSHDAAELAALLAAAGLEVDAVPDPAAALASGLTRAKDERLPLVVFGSAYLLPHVFAAFGG